MTTKAQKIIEERERSVWARALARRLIPAGMLGVALVLVVELIFVLTDFVHLAGQMIVP